MNIKAAFLPWDSHTKQCSHKPDKNPRRGTRPHPCRGGAGLFVYGVICEYKHLYVRAGVHTTLEYKPWHGTLLQRLPGSRKTIWQSHAACLMAPCARLCGRAVVSTKWAHTELKLQRQEHSSPSTALGQATATFLSSSGSMILTWERRDGMVSQQDNMGLKANAWVWIWDHVQTASCTQEQLLCLCVDSRHSMNMHSVGTWSKNGQRACKNKSLVTWVSSEHRTVLGMCLHASPR